MSLIERVADLLEQMPQPDRKPLATGVASDTVGPSVIERAINNKARSPEVARDEGIVAVEDDLRGPAPVAAKSPRAASKVSRTLNINVAALHQQNIITPDGARSPIAESFRRVKRQILANATPGASGVPTNLIMVTSPLPGAGKTFCSINLAISMAMEMDRTVLLVDADVARPSIPKVLGVEMDKGLMDVLLDRKIDLADVLFKTDIDKLSILPAGGGHQHATELLASEAMRALLQEMAERYHDRIIIFDSPPLLAASEASVLATRMGQIVMIVEAAKTTERELKDALSRIESCNLAGLLLNKCTPRGSGHYGDYGYGYGYGWLWLWL